jgi:hypothetical protein
MNQNLMLAAFASPQSTAMSAKSTAEVFVVQSLGTPMDAAITLQLIATIDAVPSFTLLVSDIQASLSSGTSPLLSQNVATDLSNAIADTMSAGYSQQSTMQFSARPRSVTQSAAPPLPYQIIGPFATLPTLYSVYIDTVNTGNGGVNLKNTMPIAFVASSQDSSGNQIANNVSLPGFDIVDDLFNNQSVLPQAVAIAGSGESFVLDISEIQTEQSNLTNGLADLSVFLLAQALDMKVSSSPQLQSCATSGAKTLVNALISANSTLITTTATGAQLSTTMVVTLSAQLVSGVVSTIVQCARPDLIGGSVVSSVVQNLTKYLVPYLGEAAIVWKVASVASSARGPLTELGETIYYWNTSTAVNVCETGGQLGTCPRTMTLTVTWTVTPITATGWSGTDQLTISSGQLTYTGSLELGGSTIQRTESGSEPYVTPNPPTPGAPWSFDIGVPITWSNGPGWGGTTSGTVTIQATPIQGVGYSLSTNSAGSSYWQYGYAVTTVTASGTISGP